MVVAFNMDGGMDKQGDKERIPPSFEQYDLLIPFSFPISSVSPF